MFLKACINGARHPSEHPALPSTVDQMAADVRSVVAAGAHGVHLHVKDPRGVDTLVAEPLADVLAAVRALAPSIPVGVTTGAWALPDAGLRMKAIDSWTLQPDFASVNWHESGAEQIATCLIERGIGVEAGLWHEDAVALWSRSPIREQCVRVLIELPDGLDETVTLSTARRLLALVRESTQDRVPVLLHGEGSSCWPALRLATRLGLLMRIGLEDTLVRPDGASAPDNATLIRDALQMIQEERARSARGQ